MQADIRSFLLAPPHFPCHHVAMKSRSPQLLALAILAAFIIQTASGAEATLLLHWNHQSQFTGYYVAKEKGFYRKHGLEIAIQRGGSDVDFRACMAEGRALFCTTMLFTALEFNDKGLKLAHLAQLVNRSNFTIVARKDSGILKPEDLQGRRISIWRGEFEPPYDGFFKRYGLHPIIEPQYYTINLFLRRGVDACSAMYYNEYHTILQCGVDPDELTTFRLREHGLDFPEDGLYCLAGTARDQPDLCRAMAAASLEGWVYAKDHPEEALNIVMDYIRQNHVPTNRAHMKWMLEQMLASIFPGQGDTWQVGVLTRGQYERTVNLLREQGLIRGAPAFDVFHREAPANVH